MTQTGEEVHFRNAESTAVLVCGWLFKSSRKQNKEQSVIRTSQGLGSVPEATAFLEHEFLPTPFTPANEC